METNPAHERPARTRFDDLGSYLVDRYRDKGCPIVDLRAELGCGGTLLRTALRRLGITRPPHCGSQEATWDAISQE
jgi:hypothetical protein